MSSDQVSQKVTQLVLNCDIGESFGAWKMGLDDEVMPHIDWANVACGFHAGDPSVMKKTVQLAQKHNVVVGAHPSYPDLNGFGRRSMKCSAQELTDLIQYQVGALAGIAKVVGTSIDYVKPHGALYNDMMAEPAVLRTVFEAVRTYDARLAIVVLATTENDAVRQLAMELDVQVKFEAFADRAYTVSGLLVPRTQKGAVHHDVETIVKQAQKISRGEPLQTLDGKTIVIEADTLCVHGDNASSIEAIKSIRAALSR